MTSPTPARSIPRHPEVIVVGAGPVGLMTAVELRRRGVDVLVVDSRTERAPWAKAVGIQPRTLEIWDAVGIVRPALDAGTPMRGQLVYVNGEQTGRMDMTLPDEVPYRFMALPQYDSERILEEHLVSLGGSVHRGVQCVSLTQGADGVTAVLRADGGEISVRAQYLVGCDGAHSVVRKQLGLSFDGGAFPEEYMLADVEVDWDLPPGYGVRATHLTDGVVDDALVCIPLPGVKRYRMSMLVPPELATPSAAPETVEHGLAAGRGPELHHIQAVLDRLAPIPTTAGRMRWSSIFRISHRLAGKYSEGRVFVAGDAAHIHPPTGAQGMNTGLQDAFNLGWKLALAVQCHASPGLLDSYHAERHPIGEEVVGRTVRAARNGIGDGEKSFATLILREAQLLVGYPDSPLVGGSADLGAVPPGMRAPDAVGLRQPLTSFDIRWHELLRHPGHTLLVWAPDVAAATRAWELTEAVAELHPGLVRSYIAVPGTAPDADIPGRLVRDVTGNLATAYGFGPATVVLIRPDGYLGYVGPLEAGPLLAHFSMTVTARRMVPFD